MTIIALIIGAAIGAPARFVVHHAVERRSLTPHFPWGLLVVNVLGSFIAGLVLALTSGDLRVLMLTGFCGAFTTFSGFGWETDRLWGVSRKAYWLSVISMPVACTVAFLLAYALSTQ